MTFDLIDLDLVGQARARLARALELVTAIETAGAELKALVEDPDDPIAKLPLDLTATAHAAETQATKARAALEAGDAPDEVLDVEDAEAAVRVQDGDEPPAPSPTAGIDSKAIGAARRARLLEYAQEHPGRWLAASEFGRAIDVPARYLSKSLSSLAGSGDLEHNGLAGGASRYRAPDPDEPDGPEDETDEPTAGAAPAPATKSPGLSGPMRRHLAAEQKRAAQDDGKVGVGEPNTITDRIIEALRDEPATLPELFDTLDIAAGDRADYVQELMLMRSRKQVRPVDERDGNRVYGLADVLAP